MRTLLVAIGAGCGPGPAWIPDAPDPTVAIVSHAPGAQVRSGASALVGIVGGEGPLQTRWFVDGAEVCASEAEPDGATRCHVTLAEGDHRLTLEGTDADGGRGLAVVDVRVEELTPIATITTPTDGQTVSSDGTLLVGVVSDPDDPWTALAVSWSSSLDGPLGLDPVAADGGLTTGLVDLTPGIHTLALAAEDPSGRVGHATVAVTVVDAALGPSVSLIQPVPGALVDAGTLLGFEAVVLDPDDAASAIEVAWSSESDGPLGAGPGLTTLDVALSAGPHTVVVVATDPSGATASDRMDVVVNGAPSAPGVALTPTIPGTADDLVAAVAQPSVDPEGDPITYTWAWEVDGAPSYASTTDRVPAHATVRGQRWTVTVTPSDGRIPGAIGQATVRVGNTAPVLADLSLGPDPALAGVPLHCAPGDIVDLDGDPVQLDYVWWIDGVPIPGASHLSADAVVPGAKIGCAATPVDPQVAGDPVFATPVTVNHPPRAQATLSPDPATVADDVSCTISSTDADGDVVTTERRWWIDGTPQAHDDPTLAAGLASGTEVRCGAIPRDPLQAGAGAVATLVVGNARPTATVTLSPASPGTLDRVVATVETADADGDPVTPWFTWSVDGAAIGEASDALDGDWFVRGQTVEVVVVPWDGHDTGDAVAAEVTVVNTGPTAPIVAITPRVATDDDPLVCDLVDLSTDPDGDPITYATAWTVDAVAHASDPVPAEDTLPGQSWTCTVVPHDGYVAGPGGTDVALVDPVCTDPAADLVTAGATVLAIDRGDATSATISAAVLPAFNSIAVRPSDGLTVAHASQLRSLYSLDPCTGAAALIGYVTADGCGLTFTADGRLFLVDHVKDQLLELDPATAAVIGQQFLWFDVGNCGLAHDCAEGIVWGADGVTDTLWTLDVDTATARTVWTLPFDLGDQVGLAIDPDGRAWTVDAAHDLWSIDVDAGDTVVVGNVGTPVNDLSLHVCP